jgi:hypothetical protein
MSQEVGYDIHESVTRCAYRYTRESRVLQYNIMVRSTRSSNRRQKLQTGVDYMKVTLPDANAIISGVIPKISRASRNCKPRCLHFAPSRAKFEEKYPDHFFCTECDNLYQTWVVIGAEPRNSVNCGKCLCTATHDNFIRPSQLKPVSEEVIQKKDVYISQLGKQLGNSTNHFVNYCFVGNLP